MNMKLLAFLLTAAKVAQPIDAVSLSHSREPKRGLSTLTDDLQELELEYIVGNDFFQFQDEAFEWIGSGGCSATNYTIHDYCHLESVYTCRDLCSAHSDCVGFDFAFAAAGCDGGTWCIVYRGEEGQPITETTKFGLAVTSEDENPYENGRVNCVKVVDPITKEVEVLNNGDGECRLKDCLACESPWDESDSGCIAATYDECMYGCLAKERCRGFKWNGPPYAFKRCATVHADRYPDAVGKAWCEHYQVPKDVPLSDALGDAWAVGGTVVHPGGGKECYVRKNFNSKPPDDLQELELEYIVGNDFFQFQDEAFEWIGSGGCSATNYTIHDYCHLESVYTCRDLCSAHSDCVGFDFAFAAAGCDGGTWCIVYRGEEGQPITETTKFGLAVTSEDENPYENGRVNCVKVVDPITKEVEVLNNGDGECRLKDCLACESPWDESDSGCIAATYDECMYGCLAKERCRGFKWNGPPYAFKRCATVHADRYPDAVGKAWCEHYQVPKDVPLSDALGDAWAVGGTVVHPGGGKECYVRRSVPAAAASTSKSFGNQNTEQKQKEVLAILVKPFALLSMLGSLFIIVEAFGTAAKREMVYHRLMCLMSIFDFIFSFTLFIGTWADPKGSGWYGASGNEATCSAKAFFTVLSAAPAVMLNAGVGVYYVLLVRYKFTEEKLAKLQPGLIFPFFFGLVGAITCLLMGLYHPFQQFGCFITYPPDCEWTESGCHQPVHQLRFVFLHVPYWISFGLGLTSMIILYATVAVHQEPDSVSDKHGLDALWFMTKEVGQDDSQTTRTRRIAKQAFWYLLCFFFTYIFATVKEIMEAAGLVAPYALAVLAAITLPSRGVWNAMIYIRPRYLRNRQKHPEKSRYWALTTASDEHDHALGARYMRSMRVFVGSMRGFGSQSQAQATAA